MYYYHITTKKHWDAIKRHGLKPHLGARSRFAGDTAKTISLCREQDIPYWMVMLYPHHWMNPRRMQELVLLRIQNLSINLTQLRDFTLYQEYDVHKTIPKKQIAVISVTDLFPDFQEQCKQAHHEIFLFHIEAALIYGGSNYAIGLQGLNKNKTYLRGSVTLPFSFCHCLERYIRRICMRIFLRKSQKFTEKHS